MDSFWVVRIDFNLFTILLCMKSKQKFKTIFFSHVNLLTKPSPKSP